MAHTGTFTLQDYNDAGASGLTTAVAILYKRSAASPAKPTTTTTFTFATGAMTGQDNGWTQAIPASNGNPLWVIQAVASAIAPAASDTILYTEWSSPVKIVENGAAGTPGYNSAVLYLYQRKSSAPATTDITDPITYTFLTKAITNYPTSTGAWTTTIPAGTDPLYVIVATASSNTSTDTIARSEWGTPVVMAQNGEDGTPAQYVIVNGEQAFKYLTGSSTPVSSSITLTANLFGGLTTYDWEYWNGAWTNLSGTQNTQTYSLAHDNAAWGTATSLRIRCLSGTAYDEITIVKLYDGAAGTNGDPAYTLILSNESHTFAGDTDGAVAGSTTCNVIGYKGTTQMATTIGTISGAPTGMSTSITNNGTTSAYFTITVTTSMVTKSGTLTIPITIDGILINKTFSYSIALKGATGSSGTNARAVSLNTSTQAFTYLANGTTPSPAGPITMTATAYNTTGTVYYEFIKDGSQVQHTTSNTYSYTPQASFTNMPDLMVVNIREGAVGNPILATDTLSMIGVKPGTNGTNGVDGDDGLNAFTVYLTNESHTFSANSSGTITDYTGGVSSIRVYYGTTLLTCSSTGTGAPTVNNTYTITAIANTSGTITVAPSLVGSQYTLTPSNMATDSASKTLTIVAQVGGVDYTFTKVLSYSKSKAGVDGQDGTDGVNGSRTAILEMYQWAVSAPALFPSGTSTYTWSTGTFTAPATPNSWTILPGSGSAGKALWTCRTIYSDSLTDATSVVTWNANAAYAVGAYGSNGIDGDDGVNGTRTAVIELYKWSASIPNTYPSGTSTYTWLNGTFTNPATLNGWSQTIGAPMLGQTLYGISQSYADTNTSATSIITWASTSPYPIGYSGTNGTNGTNGKTYIGIINDGVRSITFDSDGSNPTPSQTAFSCQLYQDGSLVTPATYAWSATGHLSGTSTTATFTPICSTTFDALYNDTIALTLTYSGQTIKMVIPISVTKTGDMGATGNSGDPGYSIFFEYESGDIPCDINGTPKNSTPYLTNIITVYSGITALPAVETSTGPMNFSFIIESATNCSATITAGYYDRFDLTAVTREDEGEVVIKVIVDDAYIYKKFKWIKTIDYTFFPTYDPTFTYLEGDYYIDILEDTYRIISGSPVNITSYLKTEGNLLENRVGSYIGTSLDANGNYTLDIANLFSSIEIYSGTEILFTAPQVRIAADLLAKSMKTGELTIVDNLDNETFKIDSTGSITMKGFVQSFEYIPGSIGWQIDPGGNSEFNNTIIRGSVILPNAGMTDMGNSSGSSITNLITNGDFSGGTTGWGLIGATGSIVNGEFLITGIGNNTYPQTYQITNLAYSNGQKIYVRAKNKVTNSLCTQIRFLLVASGMTTVSGIQQTSPINDITYDSGIILTSGVGGSGNFSIYIAHDYATLANATGAILYTDKVVAINLTSAFGVGNEPTAEEMDEWLLSDFAFGWFDGEAVFNPVRIWAGANLDNRANAPFQVRQDGSIHATTGTFGGTFTGFLELGDIKITDIDGDLDGNAEIIFEHESEVNTIPIKISVLDTHFSAPFYIGDNTSKSFYVEQDIITIENNKLVINNSTNILKNNIVFPNQTTGNLIEFNGTSHSFFIEATNEFTLNTNNGSPTNNFDFQFKHNTAADVKVLIDGSLEITNFINFDLITTDLKIQKKTDTGNAGIDFVFV